MSCHVCSLSFRTNSWSHRSMPEGHLSAEILTILSHNDDIRTPDHFACKGRATRYYDEFPSMQEGFPL
jgi:hypothetical protein